MKQRSRQAEQESDVQVEENGGQIGGDPNKRFDSSVANVVNQIVCLKKQSLQSHQDDAGQDTLMREEEEEEEKK